MLINFFLIGKICAQFVTQEVAKTHARLSFHGDKNMLVITKNEDEIFIKTLNVKLLQDIQKDLNKLTLHKKYFKTTTFLTPNENENVSTIVIKLVSKDVELFSFYKDRDKKHVLDFWIDAEEVAQEKVDIKEEPTKIKNTAPAPKKITVLKKPEVKIEKKATVVANKKKVAGPYRDFRYGASFIWDYKGLGPVINPTFDITKKTPEFFYPIKNREFNKSEKEAHLQLAINLYRKKKWGLMNKSLELYKSKYGQDEDADFIEYLKANTILKNNIQEGSREPVKMAISMLNTISSRTQIYDLKKGIYKYLLTYYTKNNEHIEALKIAKQFYVSSKENYDYEETSGAAEHILYHLSALNQIEKLKEVVNDKTIVKIIKSQTLLAYELFVHFKLGETEKVISIYEKNKNGFAKPIHPSILFNVAESYFRNGEYKKSVSVFDDFLTQYSFHPKSSEARLRIALSYELLNEDIEKVTALYKNAINRTSDWDVSYEAKLRYVAVRTIRKRVPKKEDLELRVFLSNEEGKKLNVNLKKLLWQVRLRTFLNDRKYTDALSYLNAIPVTALTPSERRVFEADGAEVIYGIILNFYMNSEFSKVVKTWTIYKNKYIEKVANDSVMNFIVGQSYLKLKLYDNYDKVFQEFEKLSLSPKRTFPIWVKRGRMVAKENVLIELELNKNIYLQNWELAQKNLTKLAEIRMDYNQLNYYQGTIDFHKKDFLKSAKSFETFFANQKEKTIYDPAELSSLIQNYTDSLYQLNKLEKFEKVSEAILRDVDNYAPTNPFMKKMRERLEYLTVEIKAGKASKEAFMSVEGLASKFLSTHKDSLYTSRVNYLYGLSLIKNKKVKEGRGVLEELLKSENTSNYLKELAKTELSLLAIENRTL